MAKTIKFNLICDERPVRTVEDLQNNFSIEDVLTYYNNKLLHRWLEVRGYNEELEKVNAINVEKPVEIIKELIKIFNVVCDDKKVEESVYMLEFLDEREFLCEEYNKQNYKTKQVIEDYKAGYRQLVKGILENPDDVAKIKANISEIVTNYKWVLDMNHRDFFWTLREKSVLGIMCLIMNGQSRNYYLPVKKNVIRQAIEYIVGSIAKNSDYVEMSDDKEEMYQEICELVKTSDFKEKLGDNLVSFAGVTDGYWKDLEPKGKKFMVISMGDGDFVRSAGLSGGDLGHDDVLDQFVIIDGIDYKSNSASRKLLYMEV